MSDVSEFDSKDPNTWPIPGFAVYTRHPNGNARRLSEYGDGWLDGFDLALQMADKFHKTGEWKVDR